MGNEEMALVPGVQYGLSSRSNLGRNKSLIFTKLTDSSYRAISEYLKNRVSNSFCVSAIHALSLSLALERLGLSFARARRQPRCRVVRECVARLGYVIHTYVCLTDTHAYVCLRACRMTTRMCARGYVHTCVVI